jgi:UDP:flavonoid glycosyltransferase YjiC (YdhE family)
MLTWTDSKHRHTVHLSFGAKFRALAFKAINGWIDQLTQDAIKLARDDGIPKANDRSINRLSISRNLSNQSAEERTDVQPDLLVQRDELIKILQVSQTWKKVWVKARGFRTTGSNLCFST